VTTYGAAEFAAEYGLTPEQREQAERYAALLLETQSHTNLIGAATIPDLWRRHFADSAQLLALGPEGGRWVDLGSGAGFPGLVLAILNQPVTLIESRQKKAAFLARTAEALGLGDRVEVRAERIESSPAYKAAAITCRALAPVARLFDWGLRFAQHNTVWILPKGATVDSELSKAATRFRFDHRLVPSRTAANGRIVVAHNVFHVKQGRR